MSAEAVDLSRILEARTRITPYIEVTPLREAPDLGVWLKLENRQRTGSFKLRGALARILDLPDAGARRGIVAASAGNHGLGVAYAARLRRAPATIVVPQGAVPAKVEAIREQGAALRVVAGGYADAEAEGKALACRTGAVWVSGYNDPAVIAGQGTIGLELADQLEFDRGGEGWEVFVPVGGGGLACGIGVALKAVAPGARVVGVQPEASPYMHACFHGRDVQTVVERPTLADGLAGAIEARSITFDILPRVVDDMVLVGEREVLEALQHVLRSTGEVIEPSAAVAVAGALRAEQGRRRVVIVSGGNIDRALLERLRKAIG